MGNLINVTLMVAGKNASKENKTLNFSNSVVSSFFLAHFLQFNK